MGNVNVYDWAIVDSDAKVSENAQIYGNAEVYGYTEVEDNRVICGNEKVNEPLKEEYEQLNQKYEMTDEVIIVDGHELHRIKALKDFVREDKEGRESHIHTGDFGGFIEKEDNLEVDDLSWVYDDACVYGESLVSEQAAVWDHAMVYGRAVVDKNAKIMDNAKVYGSASVSDNAKIYGNARIYDCAGVSDDAEICEYATVCHNELVYRGIIRGEEYVC